MKRKLPNPVLENDWESLEEGDTIRVHCDHWKCEDKNDAFTITKIIGGCLFNCYRCGTSGIFTKGSNPSEAYRRLQDIRCTRHNSQRCSDPNYVITLPVDHIPLVTHDKSIPPHAYAWFYRYELDDEDLDTYYVSYSPKLERVIIPIYKDNKLIAWQGRDIYYNRNILLYNKGFLKKKPLKYYTEYNNKQSKLYYIINNKYNINNIILVEDIISAIKVHNYYRCTVIALLNSTLHNSVPQDLSLRDYDTTYIWLDPDAHVRAMQGTLRWQSFGLNTKCIRTDTDPKDVYYDEFPKL